MKTQIYQAISRDVRNATPSDAQRNNLFVHMARQPNTLNFKFHKKVVDMIASIQIPTGPVG